MSYGDQAYRLELLGKLQELRNNAALAVALETHDTVLRTHVAVLETRDTVLETNAGVHTLVDGLAALCGDRRRVQKAIDDLGGEEEVQKSSEKQDKLIQALPALEKIKLAAVSVHELAACWLADWPICADDRARP
jgi:hypothetical protein